MTEEVKHYQVNGKYHITIEKAAGVKTGDGFKVEVNSDNLIELETQITILYQDAKKMVASSIIPAQVEQK